MVLLRTISDAAGVSAAAAAVAVVLVLSAARRSTVGEPTKHGLTDLTEASEKGAGAKKSSVEPT